MMLLCEQGVAFDLWAGSDCARVAYCLAALGDYVDHGHQLKDHFVSISKLEMFVKIK